MQFFVHSFSPAIIIKWYNLMLHLNHTSSEIDDCVKLLIAYFIPHREIIKISMKKNCVNSCYEWNQTQRSGKATMCVKIIFTDETQEWENYDKFTRRKQIIHFELHYTIWINYAGKLTIQSNDAPITTLLRWSHRKRNWNNIINIRRIIINYYCARIVKC